MSIKVLHIAECAGGVERYLEMLLPRLKEAGITQYLICSFQYDKSKYSEIVDKVEQINLEQTFSPSKLIKNIFIVRRKIKELKPDIVYCHSSFAGGIGRLATVGLHCKTIYNPHGWAFNIK
jgi:glycosyltransferase involved in cell wall biosynthesis